MLEKPHGRHASVRYGTSRSNQKGRKEKKMVKWREASKKERRAGNMRRGGGVREERRRTK